MSEPVEHTDLIDAAEAEVAYWQSRADDGTLAGVDHDAVRHAYTTWSALAHAVRAHRLLDAALAFEAMLTHYQQVTQWTLTATEEVAELTGITGDRYAASEVALHAAASARGAMNTLAYLMGHATGYVRSQPEAPEDL